MKLRILAVVAVTALFVSVASAQSVFAGKLTGFQETPAVVSAGSGNARLAISEDEKSIAWELTYSGLEGGNALVAHIHVGQRNVAGGVSLFFCGGPPAPGPTRPACPQSGTITGTWTAADVVGPKSQGVDPANASENAFARLIQAIKAGRSYANVHTPRSPGGELRGQLVRAHDDDDEDRN